jgi:superfamily II DNA/RNA helicase
MKPESGSNRLLGITRSKAKMIEYNVPEQYQNIDLSTNPSKLFTLSIGLVGDLAADINRNEQISISPHNPQSEIRFSAHFFDAYLQSKLNESLDPYLILFGSASYYLNDLPGSSIVLAKRISGECPNLNGAGLENLLLWLLKGELFNYFELSEGLFSDIINKISLSIFQFLHTGEGLKNIHVNGKILRRLAYESGTPRQLLLSDVITAVISKKLQNSTWVALPKYSNLTVEYWKLTLQKESFIKELWPAQHLLGKANVLKGESAVVQMPTSAGKTRATELIIRSAFLAGRTSLAVIIAPFRALCHEIKNSFVSAFQDEVIGVDELSDTMQEDFEIKELLSQKQILIVTPEKFLYVLRHTPELASDIGLIIFDEGHQFDSGTRGITYELLLTSLRSMLSNQTQKVLISAVITNAQAIGEWLNESKNIVSGSNLNPTYRSIGFTSWQDKLGRIEFVSDENAEITDFFVPRVIETFHLTKKSREKKPRLFPEKTDSLSIALYLGLKLVRNGSIAIFCGRKSTVSSICEKALELIERGSSITLPTEFSNPSEVKKLTYLHIRNLGLESVATKSSNYGIFSHQGNTPHGIRLAVEYAMREGLIKFVVCTSTLAQGVNMPIRYLIVPSVYQGHDRIKIRDFHNLIGRAGRAGMHTEGSIIFADPLVYDRRNHLFHKWRWEEVKLLLEPSNSEPCTSSLLSIFYPIYSDDNKFILESSTLEFATDYINKPDEIFSLADNISNTTGFEEFSKAGIQYQVHQKIYLISAIESFLLSHLNGENLLSEAKSLAEETLAFHLADKEQKENILELFQVLANNIATKISDPDRRKAYGKTLYGVRDIQAIEAWVKTNIDSLLIADNETEIINIIWPIFVSQVHNGVFNKFEKQEVLQEITKKWIEGTAYHVLLDIIQERRCKLRWGKKFTAFKIDHVVDVCEGGFAFDGALLINAIIEIIEFDNLEGSSDILNQLQLFQKKLKYGLSDKLEIVVYEIGFADREIAKDIAEVLKCEPNKRHVINELRSQSKAIDFILKKYPSYFTQVFEQFVN